MLADCSGPRKEQVVENRIEFMMNEIYTNAVARDTQLSAGFSNTLGTIFLQSSRMTG